MNDFGDSFCLLDELSLLEKQYSNYVICFNDFEIIKKKLHAIIDKHNFIGSELSSSQVDYANKRLKPYLDQQTLF